VKEFAETPSFLPLGVSFIKAPVKFPIPNPKKKKKNPKNEWIFRQYEIIPVSLLLLSLVHYRNIIWNSKLHQLSSKGNQGFNQIVH